MKTVLEVIQATTAYFLKNGIENPRLNIEHLLAHVLGKRRMELYLEFDRPLSDQELSPLRELVKRRARREPLQHLLGSVEFCGRTFKSDKRALVPRPETEQFCELILAEARGMGALSRVLDVGTGSGVIAATLALELPNAVVEAVDTSVDALALTRENLALHSLVDRVPVLQSDLFSEVRGNFQLIVANLPYIDSTEIATLSAEVRHDPMLALDGGEAGVEIFQRFIPAACGFLKGRLALEIGHDQAEPLRSLLAVHNYQDIRVLADYQGRHRFIFASYG